jgi:membrane protein
VKLNAVVPLGKETFSDWSSDKAPRLAAALAYYTIFSIAPLLIVILAIAGLVFGQKAAQGQLTSQIQQLVGPASAQAIQEMLAHARHPTHSIVATVIGTITLVLGAGGVFGALQDALNTIWGVEPKPNAGFMRMVKDRFLSFSMVLGLGFILMVSLVLSAGISAVASYFGGRLSGAPWLWEALNTVVSFGIFALLFAMMFKILPDAKVQWRDVWIGALLTALLFTIGKFAIGLYLGRGAVGSAYGAAGSFVVLLLWIYYSAQILFFGAEFTKVYAKRYGSKIVPDEDAIPVSPEARADQGLKPQPSKPNHPSPARPVEEPHVRYPAPIGPGMPASSHLHTSHAGSTIRVAGLIGAAIGLVVGLVRRPRQPERH